MKKFTWNGPTLNVPTIVIIVLLISVFGYAVLRPNDFNETIELVIKKEESEALIVENEKLIKDNEELALENEELAQEKDVYSVSNANLQDHLQSTLAEMQTVHERYLESTASKEVLQNQMLKYTDEVLKLSKEKNLSDKTIKWAQNERRKLELKVEDLNKIILDQEQKYEDLMNCFDKLKSDLLKVQIAGSSKDSMILELEEMIKGFKKNPMTLIPELTIHSLELKALENGRFDDRNKNIRFTNRAKKTKEFRLTGITNRDLLDYDLLRLSVESNTKYSHDLIITRSDTGPRGNIHKNRISAFIKPFGKYKFKPGVYQLKVYYFNELIAKSEPIKLS